MALPRHTNIDATWEGARRQIAENFRDIRDEFRQRRLAFEVREVDTRGLAAADPIRLSWSQSEPPKGVLCMHAYRIEGKTDYAVDVYGPPAWRFEGGQVVISSLGNLTTTTVHRVTFLLIG